MPAGHRGARGQEAAQRNEQTAAGKLGGIAGGSAVRLMTRNQHEITSTFPEIAEALATQAREPCAVDGEIVAFDGSQTRFERLQQRLGQARPSAALLAAVPAYFYLFDAPYAGDRDTRPLPLLERKRILRGLLSFDGPL